MSTKKSIKQQEKELQMREEKIKQQLDDDSDELKERLIRVGKIAAISGIVALIGYGVYRAFFAEEEEEEIEKPEPQTVRKRSSPNRLSAMFTTFALPYLERIVEGVFDDEEKKK